MACRALLSPVVWPISVLLDWALGRDIGNVYSREELKRLIDIHVMDPDAQAESGLTRADQRLIIGALEYKSKRCADCPVPPIQAPICEVRCSIFELP